MRSAFVVVWVVVASAAALAQPHSLAGVVRDPSGAVVPDGTVVVRQPGTAFERIVETGRDGRFIVAPATSGEYVIEVIAAGFSVATLTARVPLTQTIDVTLHPAPVIEAVQVVSASRQQELRESLNTNVAVLSRRQIEESGAPTVAELLREVPGVTSRRGSEGAGPAGAQIQGIDSRQVLVLLDGQPLVGARGIKRGVINLDRQSSSRLDRIEIVKGAASALYGSDAIGGVINLITREAAGRVETRGELSGANRGEFNAVAQAGMRRDRASTLFSVERHQNNGFDLTPTTFDTTAPPFERVDFMARVRYSPSDAVMLSVLTSGYNNHTTGRSNGELGPQQDDIRDSTLNTNLQLDWRPRPSTTLQARAYVARYNEDSAGQLAPPAATPLAPGALDQQTLKFDASAARLLGPRQQLQGGVEYWRDAYSGINRLRNDAGERAAIATAWLQHKLTVGGRVTTTLGLRSDTHSQFGSALSPKVAANVRAGQGVTVRASYGRGFRAPDIGQLYYRFLNPSSIYQVIGNVNLRPEYANSLQLGGEYATAGHRARFGVNLFRNDVRNLIESVSLGMPVTQAQLTELLQRENLDAGFRPVTGRLLFTYKNISEAVTEGIELDGEVAVTKQIALAGAYTYLDARDDNTALALTGRNAHQGSVRATWRSSFGLVANVRGMFSSRWIAARATVAGRPQDTYAPGYSLWDAYLSQRVIRGLNVFAALDNLAGSQDPNLGRSSATGAPLPIYRPDAGRTVRAGARWSWAK
ncbi:MAG: TonB-dependent receptor [Cyanobacteria bacterium]|nr:TonB-dependent receptor [Cyanobacteriota bacterium]